MYGVRGMRKPNPDPHPERSDAMQDISPEMILWRQIDRFLESQHARSMDGMHGALSGLSALISSMKNTDEKWDGEMSEAFSINGTEERMLSQFESAIRLIDRNGKWLKSPVKHVESGKEWREGFA